jgi:hypothetical protein
MLYYVFGPEILFLSEVDVVRTRSHGASHQHAGVAKRRWGIDLELISIGST